MCILLYWRWAYHSNQHGSNFNEHQQSLSSPQSVDVSPTQTLQVASSEFNTYIVQLRIYTDWHKLGVLLFWAVCVGTRLRRVRCWVRVTLCRFVFDKYLITCTLQLQDAELKLSKFCATRRMLFQRWRCRTRCTAFPVRTVQQHM